VWSRDNPHTRAHTHALKYCPFNTVTNCVSNFGSRVHPGGHLKISVLPWPADIVGVPTGPAADTCTSRIPVRYRYSYIVVSCIPQMVMRVQSADVPCGTTCVPFFSDHPSCFHPLTGHLYHRPLRLLIYRRTQTYRPSEIAITWTTTETCTLK